SLQTHCHFPRASYAPNSPGVNAGDTIPHATERSTKMKIAKDVTRLIGNTPLVQLNKVTAGAKGRVVAKLEAQNPANSVKDRIGAAMIEAAGRGGESKPGGSARAGPPPGNTRHALARRRRARGHRLSRAM